MSEMIILCEEEVAALLAGKAVDLIEENEEVKYRLKLSEDSPIVGVNPEGYDPWMLSLLRVDILDRYFYDEYVNHELIDEIKKEKSREKAYEALSRVIDKYGYADLIGIKSLPIVEDVMDKVRDDLIAAVKQDCFFVHFDEAAKFLIDNDSSLKSAFALLSDDAWDGISSVTLANALKKSQLISEIEDEDCFL